METSAAGWTWLKLTTSFARYDTFYNIDLGENYTNVMRTYITYKIEYIDFNSTAVVSLTVILRNVVLLNRFHERVYLHMKIRTKCLPACLRCLFNEVHKSPY